MWSQKSKGEILYSDEMELKVMHIKYVSVLAICSNS